MKIIRISDTLDLTGHTRSPLYEKVAQGLFTRPVKLGGARASGWPSDEVQAILAARIAGATDDEVRGLVKKLHDTRAIRFHAIRDSLPGCHSEVSK